MTSPATSALPRFSYGRFSITRWKKAKRYLNKPRLRHAARLLRQTIATVNEVSSQSGFTTDHYFHHVFRKEFGCTPSDYRDPWRLSP